MSTTISPVTQTADVDVNAAVRKDAPPGPGRRDRQHQEAGPDEDGDREGERDELGRMAKREAPTHASTVASGAPQQG